MRTARKIQLLKFSLQLNWRFVMSSSRVHQTIQLGLWCQKLTFGCVRGVVDRQYSLNRRHCGGRTSQRDVTWIASISYTVLDLYFSISHPQTTGHPQQLGVNPGHLDRANPNFNRTEPNQERAKDRSTTAPHFCSVLSTETE